MKANMDSFSTFFIFSLVRKHRYPRRLLDLRHDEVKAQMKVGAFVLYILIYPLVAWAWWIRPPVFVEVAKR